MSKQKKELEDEIRVYMQDAEVLCMQGTREQNPVVIATYKSAKESQKFNEKAFSEEHPELYQQYMTSTAGSRRFLIK
jgi:hypothetical protein